MVLDLLAQGFDVPELTLTEIAAEADAVLDRYEQLVMMPTVAPVEVEDIATSLLELEFEFIDLQSRFADRIHGATWLRRGLIIKSNLVSFHDCHLIARSTSMPTRLFSNPRQSHRPVC